MGRTKGTYTLTSNIEPKVGAPLDARTIVKLLADLTASNTFEYPYKGMRVFVEENNKSYTLVGSDPTVSSNWTEDGSGGGHVIKNQTGTDMNQRSNLQFVDMTLSDDAINDITKVENIHVIQSESELDDLPDGLYMLDDDEGTVIDGNEVGYDNTDSGLRSRNIQDAIDELAQGGYAHHYSTTEQVVGTWIDGKTIYERTYNNLSISVNYADSWVRTGIIMQEIDSIISTKALDSSNQNQLISCGKYADNDEIAISLASMNGAVTRTISVLSLQYTKTTD